MGQQLHPKILKIQPESRFLSVLSNQKILFKTVLSKFPLSM